MKKITHISTLLFFLVWAYFYSLDLSIHVPTYHIDGAFQTASGLFRLDSGQLPGLDFFPYLGIGPLFSLYPAFKALNSDLCASTFSAQFTIILFSSFCASILWQLIFRPKSFIYAAFVGVFFFTAPIFLAHYFSFSVPNVFEFAITPGPSLRPLRAVAPYLIVLSYYFFILNIQSSIMRIVLSGLLAGCILLWSNDFAIPSSGLFTLLIFINAYIRNELTLKNTVVFFLTLFLSWLVLLSLLTNNHVIDLLKYNFIDVAGDQWWYFGDYDENSRIFKLEHISRVIPDRNSLIAVIVLFSATLVAFKTKMIEHVLIAWIGLVLFCGGLLASIGGHLTYTYFGGFHFWGFTTLFFAILNFSLNVFQFSVARFFTLQKININVFELPIHTIMCLLMLLFSLSAWHQYNKNLEVTKKDAHQFYVPELGGYLSDDWLSYIQFIKSKNTPQLIEEYWGIWSASQKIFSNLKVDSTIHALGNTRLKSIDAIANADTITTTSYSLSPEWQPWNLSQNFWFYDDLLKHWTPIAHSPNNIVWQKHTSAYSEVPVKCMVDNNRKTINLSTDQGFYRISTLYSFSGNRLLVMVRNNISFGGNANGYVSLDPHGNKATFPAYFNKSGENTLDFIVKGYNQYSLEIHSCEATKILFKDNKVLHIPNTP